MSDEGLVGEMTSILAAAGFASAAEEARALVDAASGQADLVRELTAMRAKGAPLGQLLGRQEFLGVQLFTAKDVLVPRDETELLGKTALSLLQEMSRTPLVVDMCCGSGNLACALAVFVPAARIWASDLTDPAVTLARRNVAHLGLGQRVEVVQGDLFAPLRGRELEGRVDMVVCNPPYISSRMLGKDRAPLLAHEPREAFDGGPYGLTLHQRVVREAAEFLRPGGLLLFEMGKGQERQLQTIFKLSRAYEDLRLVADQSEAPRVIAAKRRG